MSNSHTPGEKRDLTANQEPSSWEHGWYVFEDGQVLGPLNADEALGSEKSKASGHDRMVSRKGFTQWYPVKDFAEIYAMIGAYAKRVDTTTPPPVPVNAAAYQPKSKVIAQNLENSQKISKQDIANGRFDLEQQILKSAENLESNANNATTPSVEMAENNSAEQLHSADSSPVLIDKRAIKAARRAMKRANAAGRNQSMMAPALFANRYLEVQGKLRLGRIFSPTIGAFVYTPLTLGGYWWAWFTQASEDVSWHVNGPGKWRYALPMWFCMVPGLHLIVAYLLARAVSSMERQNGYRNVSPLLTTVLALLPPLYMLRIQGALNRHWRLHVYHSMNQAQ